VLYTSLAVAAIDAAGSIVGDESCIVLSVAHGGTVGTGGCLHASRWHQQLPTADQGPVADARVSDAATAAALYPIRETRRCTLVHATVVVAMAVAVAVARFWLILPDGTRSWVYSYLQQFL
jgi:hypothetical protein